MSCKIIYRTQARTDTGKDRHMQGQTQARTDTGKDRHRQGETQARTDTGKDRRRQGRLLLLLLNLLCYPPQINERMGRRKLE